MKTLTEIEEEASLKRFGCSLFEALPRMDFMEVLEFVNDVAYEYAQQACEDLRERIADNVELNNETSCHYIEKEDILKSEIILP